MNTTHTPGPWEPRYDPAESPRAAIVSPKRRMETDARHKVCEMAACDPEHAANIALIAAAPELLAAATAVIESDAIIGNSVDAAEAFMALRKAIAKATGRG